MKLYDEGFVLKDERTGGPVSNRLYQIIRADGSRESGTTDELGRTHLVTSADIENLTIELISV